jgi:hypothetical protein
MMKKFLILILKKKEKEKNIIFKFTWSPFLIYFILFYFSINFSRAYEATSSRSWPNKRNHNNCMAWYNYHGLVLLSVTLTK